jgi:hypothetical protein
MGVNITDDKLKILKILNIMPSFIVVSIIVRCSWFI